MPEINLEQISAEVESLSLEDLKKAVLDAKVKQRVATKKYYNPEAAKATRQKRAAELKAMENRLKEEGLYDEIMKQAAIDADAKLSEEEETVGA